MEPFNKLITEYYIPDVKAEILTYIFMASYKMDAKMEDITGRYGITRAQFNILNILHHQYPNPASIAILRERTIVVKSDISRIVKRLQKNGLINCDFKKNDKRALAIYINEKGRDLFEQIVKNKEELLKPFASFQDDEIKELRLSLRKLLTEIEK